MSQVIESKPKYYRYKTRIKPLNITPPQLQMQLPEDAVVVDVELNAKGE